MAAPTSAPFPLFRLLVITGAIFVSVTSEFLPTGLLPEMATGLGVSESRVGLLVTAFAGTVVLTTAPLAVLTRRLSRKRLMVGLLLGFATANLIAGLAPTYEVLLGARILGGLSHGLFWAVTGPYSTHLVPRHQLARAVAVTSFGATVAFVAGVPLGTALGHALGWRWAFVVMSGVVLIFTVLVVVFLPPVSHRPKTVPGVTAVPLRRDPTIAAVAVVCLTVMAFALGQNAFYTYIAVWLTAVPGFSADAVSPLLFAYGAAGVLGLALAGFFGDRMPRRWTAMIIAGEGLAVAGLSLVSAVPWAVIVLFLLWGTCFSGFPALMQARLLKAASPRIRDLAAASLTTSFNLAIGIGALLGGVVLDRAGIEKLPWVLVIAVGLTLTFVLLVERYRAVRASARRSDPAPVPVGAPLG